MPRQLVQFSLCAEEVGLVVASDEYLVVSAPVRTRRAVSVYLREWRWEVDGSIRGRLDLLDMPTKTAGDHRMQGQLELEDVNFAFELIQGQ